MNILELRLEDTTVRTSTIKILRQYFPDAPIGELKKSDRSKRCHFFVQCWFLRWKKVHDEDHSKSQPGRHPH